MSAKAAPAKEDRSTGLTQFSTSIPNGHAIIIRRGDGSSIICKDGGAEVIVAPILSFAASFKLRGAFIPYRCEIIPKVSPGMGEKKFLRKVSPELKEKIQQKLRTSGRRLVMEQFNEPVITIEISIGKLDYTCLIKLTDGKDDSESKE